jgi:uncharacterized protein (DUF736 family)
MIIGNVQTADNRFAGHIRTLTLDAMIAIVPAQLSGADNAPPCRVLFVKADVCLEIGAGRDRGGARAGTYVAPQIDDPGFGLPLRANLIRSAQKVGEYHLLWSRPTPRERG